MEEAEQESRFQQWLQDHRGLILKVVRTNVDNSTDQEDLLQDILVNLWASIPNYRGDSKVTTWIYRVSIQTAMVWHRGERRRQQRQMKLLSDPARVVQSTTDKQSVDNELIEKVYSLIRQLPKVDSSIALMHLDGLSYQEMSTVLGISENYIGVKLTRIRKQLTEQLRDFQG